MEPELWQALADSAAVQLRGEFALLEGECESALSNGSARRFWSRVRELNDRVRTAPAIRLEDKLDLHHHINVLCQRARQISKELHQQSAREKLDLSERITLASEALSEGAGIEGVHAIRSDLAALRERLKRAERTMRREERQEVWNAWQAANQTAWESLVALWRQNEGALSGLLDDAESSLSSGNPRGAKERIKAFHHEAALLECARNSVRPLRDRAHELWQRADQVGKQKHADYLDHARIRLRNWREQYRRNARAVDSISGEISILEERSREATTDVAAAMVRGQLAERRRTLADMIASNQDLRDRINGAELALNES